MITNEIQELLEGGLSDERMAEVLHTLSVSPEKRAAFRQHMTLSTVMQRDRESSMLTAAEDIALWGAISGQAIPAATATQASPFFGWFAKTATLVAVGVGCYLLGSNSSTNIFRGTETAQPTVAQQSPAASSPAAPIVRPTVPADGGLAATDQGTLQSSQQAVRQNAPTRTAASSQHIAPESHRISIASGNSETAHSNTNTVSTAPAEIIPASAVPQSTVKQSAFPTEKLHSQSKSLEQNARATVPEPSNSIPNGKSETTPNNRHGEGDVSITEAPTTIAALRTGGVEVGFSEHVGMITPAPVGMKSSDPNFSNRSLDISYHHPLFGGQIGIGGRATYGTFSTVNLEAAPVRTDAGVLNIEGKLEAKTALFGEFFVNFRKPITNRIALGGEASVGGTSTANYRVGGDLFLLWFVTEKLGIQAGGGIGNYSYDLSEQRAQIIRDNKNVGINDDVSDNYHGYFWQGRYGLLYRF